MKLLRSIAALALIACAQEAGACVLTFKVDANPLKYTYDQVPTFVRERMRTAVTKTTNDLDRYNLVVAYECAPGEAETSATATFSIQKNTVYLKNINGIPLCDEQMTGGVSKCRPGGYDFVAYKGGAAVDIDEAAAVAAVKKLSVITTRDQLVSAYSAPATEKPIHDAVRLFAMLLAEATRFDYVLDDVTCSIASGTPIHFMDYWTLVHNWATIAQRVQAYKPALKPATAHDGVGSLFVPITREMVPFFNQSLVTTPPKPTDITSDGRNKQVGIRDPACAIQPKMLAFAGPTAQAERDEFFSLVAMAMVLKDWQADAKGRGHNIGSILVDKNNQPVYWARNSIRAQNNATHHGEVRLIQNFLECKGIDKYADGYTVYTTLEPCAMCAGMMAMTQVSRVVYLQADPAYGHALDALKAIQYPRVYEERTPTGLQQKTDIEQGYIDYLKGNDKSITNFLLSAPAKAVFQSAADAVKSYSPKFPENQPVVASGIAFLDAVTVETFGDEMLKRCPAPAK